MKDIQDMTSVTWDITSECNLRCKHCYNADVYFDKGENSYINNLDICIDIVRQLHTNGIEHIHFLGGEPLLANNLLPVIEEAKKYDIYVSINSNGTLLDKKMQETLLNLGIDHFTASLDGAEEETNDIIRGKGTFNLVCDNMRSFKKLIKQKNSKIQTAVAFTLTLANSKSIHKLPALAKSLNVDLIIVSMFLDIGNGKKNIELFNIQNERLIRSLEELAMTNAADYKIPIQIDSRPLIVDFLHSKYGHVYFNKKNSLCSAGETSFYIEANGGVHPCLSFRFENCVIDNIEEQEINVHSSTLHDAFKSLNWNRFLFNKSQFDVKKIPGCFNCSFNEICQPCFCYHSNSKEIDECVTLKKIVHKYYEEIKNAYIFLKNDVCVEKGRVLKNGNILAEINEMVGMDILSRAENALKLEDTVSYLFNKYDVTMEVLEYDVLTFIFKLIRMDVICLVDLEKVKFTKNDNIFADKVENEDIVIFNAEHGVIHELDEMSSYIWNKIENSSFNSIIDAIYSDYDVGKGQIKNDVAEFLINIIKLELINVVSI